ncbi:MAG: hypothetical protein IJP22_03265 [Clostridia bacterium]|nr:hypothetical protein [Clostridia bacterium]
MAKSLNRQFVLYDDKVDVLFSYSASQDRYFGSYPDFDENPRITPCGRPWVNATKEDCPYADEIYRDCGSCRFYKCEHPGDLIGVCDNDKLRKEQK